MTENEAKKKWCPYARASDLGHSPVSVNRRGNFPDQDCYCIASSCMAWRWNGDSPAFPDAGSEDSLDYNARKGFCGGFGRPVEGRLP